MIQFTISILLYGSILIAAQVVFIREMMAILGGSELAIGIVLALWLFWTGIGSYLSSRWSVHERRIKLQFMLLLFGIAIILPATVFAIRISRTFIGLSIGESADAALMIIVSFFVLLPFCLISGALFPVFSRAIAKTQSASSHTAIGSVYILEGAGACIGGIILNFIVLKHLTNIQISIVVIYISMLVIIALSCIPRKKWLAGTSSLILTIVIVFFFRTGSYNFDSHTYASMWKGYAIVHSENSVYGNLVVTDYQQQISIFENGLHLFSSNDPQKVEETVHLPLLQHPNPTSVLMIGGGINGGIRECLKHPTVQRIDYVELDPTVIRLAQNYLPENELPPLSHPKVTITIRDGRQFVKTIKKQYSIIIISLPDPSNAQINRFFTVEFFREVKRILAPSGILSLSLSSSENYINDQLAEFLGCIYSTLVEVFNDVTYIPGNTAFFFASPGKSILTQDQNIFIDRLNDRKIQTLFVNEYFLPYQLSPDRIDYFRSRLHEAPSKTLNTDLKPVVYFYHMVLWSTQFSQAMRTFFIYFKNLNYKALWIFLLFIFIIILFYIRGPYKNISAAVFTVGFSQIAFEIILLIGFQLFFGYVYSSIAILIAAFMGGLALGGWLGLTYQSSVPDAVQQLRMIQLFLALFPLIIFLQFFISTNISLIAIPILPNVFFALLMLTAGFLGGYHFQLSNTLYMQSSRIQKWGNIYAIDLFGSCLGALLISTICIPTIGIPVTCLLLMMFNIIAYMGLKFFALPK